MRGSRHSLLKRWLREGAAFTVNSANGSTVQVRTTLPGESLPPDAFTRNATSTGGISTATIPKSVIVQSPRVQPVTVANVAVLNAHPGSPKIHKSKHENGHEAPHVPPELLLLTLAGYVGTLNPALTAGLTNKIDSQFFWNFTVLDFIGMGFPRVSRSLQRGALPYDPDKDPEAQKRRGFDRWIYIKSKQAQNANWPNLYEELLREAQAAPGSLFVPAIIFSALPFASRFNALKHVTPPGRRSMWMPTHEVQQHCNNIVHFIRQKSQNQALSKDTNSNSIQQLGTDFIKHMFEPAKQLPDVQTRKMDLHINGKTLSDPYYHTSTRQLRLLQDELGNSSEFLELGKALAVHGKSLNAKTPLELKGITVPAVIDELAHVQGQLLEYDIKHGMGSAILGSKTLKRKHAVLTAKQQMLFTLMHQATLQSNSVLQPEKRMQKTLLHLPIQTSKSIEEVDVLHHLRQLDKTRDLVADGLRNYFRQNRAGSPADAIEQTVSTMRGAKSFISMGAFAWMIGWMWYLAHAIQSGREYPANRMISESMVAPKKIDNALPGFGEISLTPVEQAALRNGLNIKAYQKATHPQTPHQYSEGTLHT
jgi:hypothetical protein